MKPSLAQCMAAARAQREALDAQLAQRQSEPSDWPRGAQAVPAQVSASSIRKSNSREALDFDSLSEVSRRLCDVAASRAAEHCTPPQSPRNTQNSAAPHFPQDQEIIVIDPHIQDVMKCCGRSEQCVGPELGTETGFCGYRLLNIGSYSLRTVLGQGSFASVTAASRGEEEIAIKRVLPAAHFEALTAGSGDVDYEDIKETLRHELDVLHAVPPHAHIVTVLAASADGSAFAMPRYGTDLHTLVSQHHDSLSLGDVKTWARELASSLAHLHAHALVHCDVKPANILLMPDGSSPAKYRSSLCDFGLSRLTKTSSRQHRSTDASFPKSSDCLANDQEQTTLWYRAPELIMGAPNYSSKIDGGIAYARTQRVRDACRSSMYVILRILRFFRQAGLTVASLFDRNRMHSLRNHDIDHVCVNAVWGLGCTILECLSGAPVFNGRPDARCRYTDVSETACCRAPDSSQMCVD